MNKSIIPRLIAYSFSLLFIYTALAKLTEHRELVQQLTQIKILQPFVDVAAWLLPLSEFGIVFLLLTPRLRLKGLYLSITIMLLFTCYVVYISMFNNQPSCNCGGIIERLSGKQHLIFNSAWIIMAALGILSIQKPEISIHFNRPISTSLTVLAAAIMWMLFSASLVANPLKTGFEGQSLPVFRIQLPDSLSYLNADDIPKGQAFIVIGFSPYCGYCQKEIGDILRNIDTFEKTQIYLVTPLPFTDMKKFYDVFNIAKYHNVIIGVDSKNDFLGYYKATGIPLTAIYDSRKQLKEMIYGRAKINEITTMLVE